VSWEDGVLGGLFALLAAVTFAWTNATVRRGVVSGTAVQATTLSIPIGLPIFFTALVVSGQPGLMAELPLRSTLVFAAVGISHFIIGRYCNYRALAAIGTNLAGPVMQFSLVVSLVLAIAFLGETLTPLRILGIVLILAGPTIVSRDRSKGSAAPLQSTFTPRLAEGYVFALLGSICYGASPVLVRYAVAGQGLAASLAGGVIASAAATAVMLILLPLPGHWREVRAVRPQDAKWFVTSGILVYLSQIFAYMAVAVAPVTLTAPIIALANVFRIYLSRLLNPEHEVFGPDVIWATAVSFLGVIALTASTEVLPLPPAWSAFLAWHWP
jgi:drug/metabolite transporter (DMT)-like permease